MLKIFIADEIHPSIFPMLEELGCEHEYHPNIKREDLVNALDGVDGLIIRSKTKVDKALLINANQLKFIGRAGAGLDAIDQNYLQEKGITLLNAPEGNCDALAEHALGLLLALSNNIVKGFDEVRAGEWLREPNRGFEVGGKTVAIIGYGFMGKATAKRMKAIGANVIAYDKYLKGFSDEIVTEATLSDVFAQADIVSLHVPLTPETKCFCNEIFFNSFDKNIVFINTSRGKVVDYTELISSLDSGQIMAAGLDVFENEKLNTLTAEQESVLRNLTNRKNVILTPHVGGWSFESYVKINEALIAKIKDLNLS